MRKPTSLTSLLASAILALGTLTQVHAADGKKTDPTGTWTWNQAPRTGASAPANATPRKSTLKLKVDGEKLTGTLSTTPRAGAAADSATAPVETEITDGKVKGDEISFSAKRDIGGGTLVVKYSGKVDGDTIKGKAEYPGRKGGDPSTRDWEAKRVVAEKK